MGNRKKVPMKRCIAIVSILLLAGCLKDKGGAHEPVVFETKSESIIEIPTAPPPATDVSSGGEGCSTTEELGDCPTIETAEATIKLCEETKTIEWVTGGEEEVEVVLPCADMPEVLFKIEGNFFRIYRAGDGFHMGALVPLAQQTMYGPCVFVIDGEGEIQQLMF